MNAATHIQQALLIVEGTEGKTGYPFTDDILARVGIEKTAEAMGWIVQQRPDATSVKLRLELDNDRTTTHGWSPVEATPEHFTKALQHPRVLDNDSQLGARRVARGRWSLWVAKEVGPPRWVWPRVGVGLNRRRLNGVVGWSFTAFHWYLAWGDPR